MTTWWYSEDNKKLGPVDIDNLTRLLQIGKVNPKTMLWKEGMESWLPLNEIAELQALMEAVPPPLPPKTSADPLSYPMATRWPRFFARIFDIWWEILLVSFAISVVLGYYSAGFVEWSNNSGSNQLLPILCLPIALFLDASLYRLVGNTPGKALLGLKVGLVNASPLNFGQYLGRNFSMWVSGLALGFPFINLFTMTKQSSRLGTGRHASYDEFTGYRVRAMPIGWARKILFGVAFVGLLAVMIAINAMQQTAQREATLSSMLEDYSWTNPATNLSTTINSRWKNSVQKNVDKQQVYTFLEQADRAVVILGIEHASNYSLRDYVTALRKNTVANMRFSDGGRYFEASGKQSWQGSGNMVGDTSSRLEVQVIQIGDVFWRVVTIQVMPYDYSDQMVTQLKKQLWDTVQ